MSCRVEDLGRVPYAVGHALQLERVEARRRDEIPDTLLLLEHPPVITLGRGAEATNVLEAGEIPVVPVERGGDVTLHAPGQLVGYLIRKLEPGARDLHAHLRLLEELLIRTLAGHGVEGRREAGKTGVWVEDRKIASLGVACRHWVTWHGFALNVAVDLGLFQRINPCGFRASVMTSLDREVTSPPTLDRIRSEVAAHCRSLLDPEVSGRRVARAAGPSAAAEDLDTPDD